MASKSIHERMAEKIKVSDSRQYGGTFCQEWQANKHKFGYGVIWFEGKNRQAHRLSFAINNGKTLDEIQDVCVLHKCDNPSCVNPKHLFSGSNLDNMQDKVAKGRQSKGDTHGARIHPESRPRGNKHYAKSRPELLPQGERNGSAKLTWSKVDEIRAKYAAKIANQPQLAKEYGVHQTVISEIVRIEKWKPQFKPQSASCN